MPEITNDIKPLVSGEAEIWMKQQLLFPNFRCVHIANLTALSSNLDMSIVRGLVCNVLLTSCLDGICRLWSETLLPEDTLLGEQICETSTSSISSTVSQSGKQKDSIQQALEVQVNTCHFFISRFLKFKCLKDVELYECVLSSSYKDKNSLNYYIPVFEVC